MNNIFRKLGIIAGILCIAVGLALSIAYGFTIGNLIAFVFGGILIGLSLWFGKLPKVLKRVITIFICLGILFFVVITGVVINRGAKDTVAFDEDCLLVLGCGIRGEELLPTLQSRLDKSIEYLSINPEILVVLSGGQGHNEAIPEAEAMKRYLLKNGISEAQIITEVKSRNTKENFMYSKQILDSCFVGEKYTVACITSDYHMFRAEETAKDNGLEIHSYSAGVKWYLRPSAYSREVLSICKYWVFR